MTDPHLRDANKLLQSAVADTIGALDLTSKDAGAVRLAHEYASAIDLCCSNPEILEKLGPKLLACLESLGATPAARARMKGGKTPDAKPSELAKLRAARR